MRNLNFSSILKIARIHDKLTGSIDDAIFCFSMPALLGTAGTFAFDITTLFVLFRTVVFKDDQLVSVVGAFVLWSIFYSTYMVAVIAIGHVLKTKGKIIAHRIHDAFYECRDEKMRQDLMIFSLQLTHCHPEFSCGLFVFDWTVMYSIISAITTYLMILVQFDSSMTHASV